ncbi:TonB-dependent siderophore receptor [Mucilaginibacter sp. X5P1]|uniref:TonB-dependent receptor n=1 Tax=Mucilaginibacter sp. X5P1 TaxID=2723088 RepID=UPI0016082F98|nr:TonB-dependent receptor [Mucilaginibacter sp. X5P1]MBB6138564.1 iron complex outermembrane receptor protein [Mucilaginibacter sp. X5P1]
MNSLLLCSNTYKALSTKKTPDPFSVLKWLGCLSLIFCFQFGHAQIQTGSINGTITTSDGKPAQYVSIILSNTHKGAVSDEQGNYTISNIIPGTYTLTLKHTGMLTQSRQVEIKPGEAIITNFTISEDNKALQEVTVTSGYNKFAKKETDDVAKMPLKNLEDPQVYNVVPKELLQDENIVSYNDVLKNVAGVSQALVNGSNSFNLRGFFTTSYLRNGLQDSKGNSIEVANIESIEVLKGPSATLFGSSLTSFGGLLNRITKKPFDTFQGEISYTDGGFGLNRVTADFNTPLNPDKGLFLRTNVAYDSEGSFQDAGFTNRFFVAPSLLYKVNDRLTISLDAEIYNQKSNDFNRLFPEASLTKTNPRDLGIDWTKSYSSNDLYETDPSVSLYGTVNYKISDKWKSQTAFSQTNSTVQGDWSYNSILGDTAVSRNPGYEHTIYNYTEVQQNFNGDFKIGKMRNRVVIGLDYFTNTVNSTSAMIYGFDEVSIKGNDPRYNELTITSLNAALAKVPYSKSSTQQSTYSAYASDVLNITDNLLAMASLRVDHFVNGGTRNINADTTTGKYNQTALSPKLGLVYQIVPNQVSLFGNYMNGFSNNAPVRQPDGTFSSFKPSEANQWEGGVKLDLFDGKLNSTLSYYHIKVSDVIHNSFVSGQTQFEVQNGGQLSKGFEAEVIANLFRGFNLIAGYAYNNIYTINTDPDADGLHQWTGPAQTANLWLSYHFLGGSLKGLGLGIGGNYNGIAYIQQSRSQGEFYLPAYTVLNAVVSYDQPVYRVSLKMDNLTNEVYWGSYVSQMMPRRFSATVAFKFR